MQERNIQSRNLDEKLRKLNALSPKDAKVVLSLFLSGDTEARLEAEQLLDVLLFQHASRGFKKGIFLDPPDPSLCRGGYNLGTVMYPPGKAYAPFGMREDEWLKHMMITGITGSGKTNLVFQILSEFVRHGKPFIVFDFKSTYRDLLQLPLFKDLVVFTVGRDVAPFEFNPLLPPPGVDIGLSIGKTVDIVDHAYLGGEGVSTILKTALDAVYERFGCFEKMHTVPTFFDVKKFTDGVQADARKKLWKQSVDRIMYALTFRHSMAKVVNAQKQWDYEALLRKPVVFELDALDEDDKTFFTEAMVLWLYQYWKGNGRREHFSHALIIEEAHHVLSLNKERMEGAETVIETSIRQIREFGVPVIAVDQQPQKMSASIKANTYGKITFNLGNGEDVQDVARCMGLDLEESDYIKLLETGYGIVSLKGRILTPLLVKFPKIEIKKGLIKDFDLRRRMNVVK